MLYILVKDDQTQIEWLGENAHLIESKLLAKSLLYESNDKRQAIICVIDNDQFIAVCVADTRKEFELLLSKDDQRKKIFMTAPVKSLFDKSGISENDIKRLIFN